MRTTTAERSARFASRASLLVALRAQGRVEVVVMLRDPFPDRVPGGEPTLRRLAIAEILQAVLDRLDPMDFRSRCLLETVPTVAGTLLSERGLAVLVSHPDVRRVDLDAKGGGTGEPRP